MFKCQQCKEIIGPKIPEEHVITETRDREYSETTKDRHKNYFTQEFSGEEIVEEKSMCQECAEAYREKNHG